MTSSFADLFEWRDWVDLGVVVFYDCTLLKKIGDYDVGYFFKTITWDSQRLKLVFGTEMEKTLGIVD